MIKEKKSLLLTPKAPPQNKMTEGEIYKILWIKIMTQDFYIQSRHINEDSKKVSQTCKQFFNIPKTYICLKREDEVSETLVNNELKVKWP